MRVALSLSALVTAVLLTACASGPEPAGVADTERCYQQDRPTGSNIIRRDTCASTAQPKEAGKS